MDVEAYFDAIERGDVTRVRELVAASPRLLSQSLPADPTGDGTRRSGLHVAAAAGRADVARALLDAGIEIDAVNDEGRTALHDAIELGQREVERLLIERGATIDVCAAAILGRIERLRALLDAEPALANDRTTGLSPLGWAAFGNRCDCATLLLDRGARLDDGELLCAAAVGHVEVGRLLVERGAAVDEACGAGGMAAIHAAAAMRYSRDSRAFVRMLAESGAELGRPLSDGRTALDLAESGASRQDAARDDAVDGRRRFAEMAALLRELGARPGCSADDRDPKKPAPATDNRRRTSYNAPRFDAPRPGPTTLHEELPMGPVADLEIRGDLAREYGDVFTGEALAALAALIPFDAERRTLMERRARLRRERIRERRPIDFLDADATIDGTSITVRDARAGRFEGAEIPADLERQWIQGTGPAARPRTPIERSLRNVAYALLSGADGWMFDGEDALGQLETMSLDNQRNLKLAIARDPSFTAVAERVAGEMNRWSREFFGREIVDDWRRQLDATTVIYRARGLHLDDRHVRTAADRVAVGASLVDAALYVANNHRDLAAAGRSIVLYLPKIQTAAEAALWNRMLHALESQLGLAAGTIKAYVLVEQVEASFQLMEIRAALAPHFVGFNTGRWDYINSVADARTWDPEFVNPNIDAITMTYGYMRHYEDRVRRAVNTPDAVGRFALWQGGMEPNIPVGSADGVKAGMARAVAGAEREQREGASGKWVAHWKMVHIVRPVWEAAGEANQAGRRFPALEYDAPAASGLTLLEPAPRTIRGARDLISVALQYGNAFGRGFQAAALKPADFFGDDDVLYLMEDMATGEIRLSILWEWLHKAATMTEADAASGIAAGDQFTRELFERLVDEEYAKLRAADDRDVHDDSKSTTLPISREIVLTYVLDPVKPAWFIDLLNINLGVDGLDEARRRIRLFMDAFRADGTRITDNLDFDAAH